MKALWLGLLLATGMVMLGAACAGGDDDDSDSAPNRPRFTGQSSLLRAATPVFDPCHSSYCAPYQDAHTNMSCVMSTLICTSTMTPTPTATATP
jgi:hypothetical protein